MLRGGRNLTSQQGQTFHDENEHSGHAFECLGLVWKIALENEDLG